MNNKSATMEHAEIIEWAMKILQQPEMSTEIIVETSWSTVLKIITHQGPVYLKQTPLDLFVEVDVIQKCRDICKISDIPEIIAADKNLHCFLMKECGDASLRTVLDGHLNVDLLMQGLQVYRRMQQSTIPHVDAFLQVGVPDWRLEHFPKLYQVIVNNEDFLLTHGLKAAQITILQDAIRIVETLCQTLSQYGVPECLNHSDFHDNNMLFRNVRNTVSIIDLGETAITHPFFSLAAFLKVSCDRYNIAFASTEYHKLNGMCFNGWLDDNKSMMSVIEIIHILLPVYWLFAQKRFLDVIHLPYSADNPVSIKQHDKIKQACIKFIAAIEAL